MPAPHLRRAAAIVAVLLAVAGVFATFRLFHKRWQPESLALAPDGTLLVGSATSPFVYRMQPGTANGERFIDASSEGEGTFFFGVLADAFTDTLWACQLTPVPGATPAKLHSVVRGFELTTGTEKRRWNLPGDNSMCNDFAIGPEKALYITDTVNGRVYRMQSGAGVATLLLEDRALVGVDGIAFLDGVLYANNLFTGQLYRIPVDADGKPGSPINIHLQHELKGPDGMRAVKGRLLVAESGSGRITALTVKDDWAKVAVIREGLNQPTGLEPVGNTIWVAERGANRIVPVVAQ